MSRITLRSMASETEVQEMQQQVAVATAMAEPNAAESPLHEFLYPEDTVVVDHFSEMAAEQEILQAPVGMIEDADLDHSGECDRVAAAYSDVTAGKADVAVALEELADMLTRRVKQGGGFSMEEASLVHMNAQLLMMHAQKAKPLHMFSMEGDQPVFAARAIEDIREATEGLYGFLRDKLKNAVKHIADVIGYFGRNMMRLRWKYERLARSYHELKVMKPRLSAIKPEAWCKYLCYSKGGFDTGLKRVMKDVQVFVDEHMQMANKTVNANINWFKQALQSGAESDTSEGYSFSPQDHMILDMTEFHRTVGFRSTHGDQINYRSRELPGGKAFYLEALPNTARGQEAFTAFEHVRFAFGEYNPESWNMFQAKLTAVIGLPVTLWLSLVNPFLGLAAAGATAYASMQAKYKDTNAGKVHIDQSVMFDVLKHDEIRAVLDEVRAGMAQLERWNMAVLQKPWKGHDLDRLVDGVMSDDYSNSQLRGFCNSLIGYMSQLGAHVHTYAFKVYGAALNFVEKSCKQYF